MLVIKIGDITKEEVDVIVNAANTSLLGGGGVDGAIHKAGGPSILEECKGIGGCKTGDAVITNAGNLKAKKVIHTPGPVWHGGNHRESDLLRSAYRNSFLLAKKENLKTIAFPAISTGVYGYPKKEAAKIALQEGKNFIRDFVEIKYVCFSESDYKIYLKEWESLKSSIKDIND
jgi:O-acetyl-ADP-ribose deacetylase (regulator of RNase III)